MRYEEIYARELVIRACHELVEHKLIARTWRNVSARISDTHFVITPSDNGCDTLKPRKLYAGNGKLFKEISLAQEGLS